MGAKDSAVNFVRKAPDHIQSEGRTWVQQIGRTWVQKIQQSIL